MLEQLDTLNWSDYRHAYGIATDVPAAIRALLLPATPDSNEPSVWGLLWHQGTIYSATVVAIPFMLELLALRATPQTQSVLELLYQCGRGSGFLMVHGDLDFFDDRRGTLEFEAQLAEERRIVAATRAAVCAGVEVYRTFLHDENPYIRDTVADLLALCQAPP